MENIIEDIVKLEWQFFDKVQNEGGRAFCQDDWETFSIMRSSQYMEWNRPLLESWLGDLELAQAEGRNPLTEKYGYMMCISAPDDNAETAARIPFVSDEKKAICERIVARLLVQNESFRRQYPKVAGHGRPLRTIEEAQAGFTSVETYQTGELYTYSIKTLELLEKLVLKMEEEGKSYPAAIIENSLRRRGFKDLSDAEWYLNAREK